MANMDNPFKYGVIVTGKDFVDREKELDELARELKNGKSVVLYSNRRMGKSSLLAEFVRRHRKEFIFVSVDLYGITEKRLFLEVFSNAVLHATYGRAGRFASGLWELLRGTGLRAVITDKGSLGVELTEKEPKQSDLNDILDLPEKGARKRRKRFVVIFDEFQETFVFGGVPLIKSMRARFQLHKDVVYVFSGSKRHVLHGIFDEREGAFFKFARPMELRPMPVLVLTDFVVKQFKRAGGAIDRRAAKRLVDVSKGCPYYSQQLAHELYNIYKLNPSEEQVERAIGSALEHQSPAFSYVWDSIKSPLQRRYLKAVAEETGVAIGSEFIEKHHLKSRSHVQRVQTRLDARGLTEAGKIVDPLFALWLRRLSGPGL